jgi:Jacalin-like lectin domain
MSTSGPSGGGGGEEFNDEPLLEAGTRVIQVEGRGKQFVDFVQFTHIRSNGSLLELPHGGPGGQPPDPPALNLAEGEFITKIEGKCGQFVDSLTIYTNRGQTYSLGGSGGSYFGYEAPQGYEIAGFIGRSKRLIDAIGVVLRAQ